jgi:hypothetical protein
VITNYFCELILHNKLGKPYLSKSGLTLDCVIQQNRAALSALVVFPSHLTLFPPPGVKREWGIHSQKRKLVYERKIYVSPVLTCFRRAIRDDGPHRFLPGSHSAGPSQSQGHKLDEITFALAKFQDTFDPSFLPNTRFQLLVTSTGSATFTVRPGTFFFVPVFSFNDSPPVIGDFPTNSSQVVNYIFGTNEAGAQNVQMSIDGRVFNLGPSYVSGLVNTPDLINGGSHTILLGAFLTPLPKGTHTITIQVTFTGAAVVALVGAPFSFEITYTVIVQHP